MTLDELQRLRFKYVGGYQTLEEAVRTYINEKHNITMLLVTKRINTDAEYGGWGAGKTHYMFDGSRRRYRSLEAFLRAYNARNP
jgi:hypothetical protein